MSETINAWPTRLRPDAPCRYRDNGRPVIDRQHVWLMVAIREEYGATAHSSTGMDLPAANATPSRTFPDNRGDVQQACNKKKNITFKTAMIVMLGSLLLAPAVSVAGFPDVPGEFLLFPHISATHSNGLPEFSDEKENDLNPAVDFFYSMTSGKFRFLAEYFLDKEEHELERIQIGWSPRPGTTFWLGRFHNPLGYWNTAFHHGKYLQTSLSRPGITDFEDDGGPLPIHITGFLVESEYYMDDALIAVDVGLGLGPEFGDEVEPVDVLDPNAGTHKESAIVRLRYFPDSDMENHIGIFIGHTRIDGDNVAIRNVKQTQSGVFGVWDQPPWLYTAALFYINDSVDTFPTGSDSGSFINAYVQAEFRWQSDWTFFARTENSFNEGDDPWLAFVPSFVHERNLAGVRYDIGKNQALTLEVARDITSDEKVNRYMLQWTGMFP